MKRVSQDFIIGELMKIDKPPIVIIEQWAEDTFRCSHYQVCDANKKKYPELKKSNEFHRRNDAGWKPFRGLVESIEEKKLLEITEKEIEMMEEYPSKPMWIMSFTRLFAEGCETMDLGKIWNPEVFVIKGVVK